MEPTETQIHRAYGRRSTDILKWWPVLAALVMALLSYGELRFQVYQNSKDLQDVEETDKAQWERIGDLLNK